MFHSGIVASDFEQLFLIEKHNKSYVPKDLFSKYRFTTLVLWGNRGAEKQFQLEIHPEAFGTFTKNYTKIFRIVNCNMHLLNFSFLSGFNELMTLDISNSNNFHLRGLPPLHNLVSLLIWDTTGLNELKIFPVLINGLNRLLLNGNGLNDNGSERILEWIYSGPSNKTLRSLDLNANSLTRIPRQVKDFQRLGAISLNDQKEPGLAFLQPIVSPSSFNLNVSHSHIKALHPATFLGFILPSLCITFKKLSINNITCFRIYWK